MKMKSIQKFSSVERQRLAYGQARRKAFVQAGLRTDGKPRAIRKPCGCLFGSCLKCATPANRLHWSAEEVAAMYTDYQRPMSLADVARLHNLDRRSLAEVFHRRGLALRPANPAPKFGRFKQAPRATDAQIVKMISGLDRVKVPAALKHEWRSWPMPKRMKFLQRVRAHLKPKNDRPTTPFSGNVTPWEYGTPAAMEIARRMNAGRNSQTKVISIRASCQGVIWDGRLWFWTARFSDGDSTGYLSGSHSRGKRLLLHHEIWKWHNQREIPPKHTVIFKDGNKNNLAPENLGLRSMADCALQNSVHNRLKADPNNRALLRAKARVVAAAQASRARSRLLKARSGTKLLLERFNKKDNHDHHSTLKDLANAGARRDER